MRSEIFYCILYSLIAVSVVPVIGASVNFIVSVVLGKGLSLINKNGKLYLFVVNTLTFPGVWYHELSHALFAFLSGAKVDKIKLYEKKDGHLGYVIYTPRGKWVSRSMQLCMASCAPVVMGMLADAAIIWLIYAVTLPVWAYILLGYLAVSILIHMDMSGADLKSYLKGCPFFFLFVMVISALFVFK